MTFYNRKSLLTVLALIACAGCANMAAIEPIKAPPKEMRFDTSVEVEFVHPAKVGVRCANRGASYFGLPSINAGACSDTVLMTVPNPCYVIGGGWYASLLCHELGHANGWQVNHEGGSYLPSAPIQPASESPEAKAAAQAAL